MSNDCRCQVSNSISLYVLCVAQFDEHMMIRVPRGREDRSASHKGSVTTPALKLVMYAILVFLSQVRLCMRSDTGDRAFSGFNSCGHESRYDRSTHLCGAVNTH